MKGRSQHLAREVRFATQSVNLSLTLQTARKSIEEADRSMCSPGATFTMQIREKGTGEGWCDGRIEERRGSDG